MSPFQQLNYLVVKADKATIQIPELEFEIPPNTQKGSITTVESIIRMSVSELERDQLVRRVRSWLYRKPSTVLVSAYSYPWLPHTSYTCDHLRYD